MQLIATYRMPLLVLLLASWLTGCANLSPVHKAIHKRDLPALEQLLAAGADPNQVSNRFTPLGFAIHQHNLTASFKGTPRSNYQVVETLIRHGADIHRPTINWMFGNKDESPLTMAVMRGADDIVDLLLSRGAKISPAEIANAMRPTHRVFRTTYYRPGNAMAVTRRLVDQIRKTGGDAMVRQYINAHDDQPRNALYYAVLNNEFVGNDKNNNLPLIQFLLDNGADPNALSLAPGASIGAAMVSSGKSQPDMWTPLHQAAQAPQPEVIQMLIQYKADPDIRSRHGLTVESILAQRAQVNAVAETGVALLLGNRSRPLVNAISDSGRIATSRQQLQQAADNQPTSVGGQFQLNQQCPNGTKINSLVNYKSPQCLAAKINYTTTMACSDSRNMESVLAACQTACGDRYCNEP